LLQLLQVKIEDIFGGFGEELEESGRRLALRQKFVV
jgi:hypothetical protein